MTTFKQAAMSATARLDELYRNNPFTDDFWFGGNALSAYVRALVATGRHDTGLLQFAFDEVYLEGRRSAGWWHDDYGWWGCAFASAIDQRETLGLSGGEHDALFRQLVGQVQYCWGQLKANWSDTAFGSDPKYPDNGTSRSDITGGSYNTKSATAVMAGRNTVTNAGFWLLSLDLVKLTDEPEARESAAALSAWFAEWFARAEGDESGIRDERGLLLERPTGHRLDPGWRWTGDQGVVMLDLLRQAALDGRDPASTPGPELVDAVIAGMTQGDAHHLEEYLGFTAEPELAGFEVDYATGKGIFMRQLGDACSILGTEWTARHADFIRANATAVWGGRDVARGGQLPFDWGTTPTVAIGEKTLELRDVVFQASGLDALSLAATYWPDVPAEGDATQPG